MESFLKTVSALNDETRMLLVAFLYVHEEACVCEFEASLEMIQSRLSRHLKILREAGFLSVERKGTWAYYRLEPKTGLHQELIKAVVALKLPVPAKISACEINKAS